MRRGVFGAAFCGGCREPAVELRAIARRRTAYRPARFRWQGRSGCRNKDNFFTAFLYRSGRFVVAFCCGGRLRSFCGIPGRVFCLSPASEFRPRFRRSILGVAFGTVCAGLSAPGVFFEDFRSGLFAQDRPNRIARPVCADRPQRAGRAAAVRSWGGKLSEC